MTAALGPARIVVLAAFAGAAATWLLTDAPLARTAALAAVSITLFAARVLPETVTAILTFLAFLASGLVSEEVIFAGFSSGGFWLVVAGLIMGAAITATGLGRQIALRLFARAGASYGRAVTLLALSGVALGVLVPSAVPRVVVLLPIAVALAEAMGYRAGSRQAAGLAITAACATLMPTYAFLTANLPVIVEAGMIEATYGVTLSYGSYFVQQWPINLIRLIVLLLLMWRFAGAVAGPEAGEAAIDAPAPFDAPQRRLLGLLGIAILFWATDVWHGIAPAWVALAAAGVILWPAVGIMGPKAMKSDVDLSPAFFIAGVLCVSAAAEATGLSARLADAVVPWLGLGSRGAFWDLVATTGFATAMSHLTTAPATPVILVPLAGSMAEATGWSIETMAMVHTLGIVNAILPYQAPPLIIAMALAQIPLGALTRVCIWLTVASFVIGLPVTFLWWRFLGLV